MNISESRQALKEFLPFIPMEHIILRSDDINMTVHDVDQWCEDNNIKADFLGLMGTNYQVWHVEDKEDRILFTLACT